MATSTNGGTAGTGSLSVIGLALMTVAAVVSLRGLPMMAVEGTTLLFYIGFAALLFLIPAALVAAELGGMFAHSQGGVYEWVKAPFGPRLGFVCDLVAVDPERRLVSDGTRLCRGVARLRHRAPDTCR